MDKHELDYLEQLHERVVHLEVKCEAFRAENSDMRLDGREFCGPACQSEARRVEREERLREKGFRRQRAPEPADQMEALREMVERLDAYRDAVRDALLDELEAAIDERIADEDASDERIRAFRWMRLKVRILRSLRTRPEVKR